MGNVRDQNGGHKMENDRPLNILNAAVPTDGAVATGSDAIIVPRTVAVADLVYEIVLRSFSALARDMAGFSCAVTAERYVDVRFQI